MKAVLSGYGKMGKIIEKTLLAKGLECAGASEDIRSFDPGLAKECVCIDFTTPAAFKENYRFLASHFKAVVVGTTGWYDIQDEVFACFNECGTPLIWASNFSVGVIVLSAATDLVSRLLANAGGYSPYVVEKHHCHKLDAPSGTAITLANEVNVNMGLTTPISSVRVGEIAGIHTVGFEGLNDRITLEHESFSRQGLADGAVLAATMIEDVEGVHNFKDLFLEML